MIEVIETAHPAHPHMVKAWRDLGEPYARAATDVLEWDAKTLNELGHEVPFVWHLCDWSTRIASAASLGFPERVLGIVASHKRDELSRFYKWDGLVLSREEDLDALVQWAEVNEDRNPALFAPVEKVIDFRVVTENQFLYSLPFTVRHMEMAYEWRGKNRRVEFAVRELYREELDIMVRYAMRCVEPRIFFGPFLKAGGNQWIADFSVSDMARPEKDEYNLHLQNTSQWAYAGAVVCSEDTGDVSSHH